MGTAADRREEARREETDDRLERHGVECEDCGHRWVPGRGCCPECGGAIRDGWREDRPTEETDPADCRWCFEESFGKAECPYHGERAQRGEG